MNFWGQGTQIGKGRYTINSTPKISDDHKNGDYMVRNIKQA
jgi:hypothetical protein